MFSCKLPAFVLALALFFILCSGCCCHSAQPLKDESCEKLTGKDRDSCYFDRAFDSQNSDYCLSIQDSNMQANCKSIFKLYGHES